MTKEEILDKHGIGGGHWEHREAVLAAMEEYREQPKSDPVDREGEITVIEIEQIYDVFANWYHDDGSHDTFLRSEAMKAINAVIKRHSGQSLKHSGAEMFDKLRKASKLLNQKGYSMFAGEIEELLKRITEPPDL